MALYWIFPNSIGRAKQLDEKIEGIIATEGYGWFKIGFNVFQ